MDKDFKPNWPELLSRGAEIFNNFRKNNPGQTPDLTGADLKGIDLKGVNLSGANLTRAILRWKDLNGTDLRYANLAGADLTGARLAGANFAFAKGLSKSFFTRWVKETNKTLFANTADLD